MSEIRGRDARLELIRRLALATLAPLVLSIYVRPLLSPFPRGWAVPLLVTFVNAAAVIFVAREALRKPLFLAFWAAWSVSWIAIAWHGAHFHRAPRPGALVMNLAEIANVPYPGISELPVAAILLSLALGALAAAGEPRPPALRQETLAAFGAFAIVQTASFIRYQTADMLRFSGYTDLVRTHGIEVAALLDSFETVRTMRSRTVLQELREDARASPAVRLALDAIAVDRMLIVQVESLDQEALTDRVAPGLARLWKSGTRGMLDVHRDSVGGSSIADFQLLTGLRPRLGIPPYKVAWDGGADGLPAWAARKGFQFHAFHGHDPHFWNRGPFFEAMGVRFHSIESIPSTEASRWGRADGDLFRYVAAQIPRMPRAVNFVITLSTHPPFDLVEPAASASGATARERYELSMQYTDRQLAHLLAVLPHEGKTLVVVYGDHSSGVYDTPGEPEPLVPLALARLAPDGAIAPLSRAGADVPAIEGTAELPAVTAYLRSCLDASAR